MTHKFEEGKELLIASVIKKIRKNISGTQSALCAEFAQQFYNTVALDDLREWDPDDLYGAIVSFWDLIRERAPHETKVRIYNPEVERDGWQTTHTVIEVICDNMPFLVDSIRMVAHRMGLSSHLIIHMGGIRLLRNKNNHVNAVFQKTAEAPADSIDEAPIFMEIDRQTDAYILEELQQNLIRALEDTAAVVSDWEQMRASVCAMIHELDNAPRSLDASEVEETKAFLTWIEDHHFTFLGVRDYELVKKDDDTILQAIPNTSFGLFRENINQATARSLSAMPPEARALTLSSHILVTSKTNTISTVHRDAYTDYIGVKRFNKQGQVIGERRIIGLYTSAAYHTNPKHIPFLRHKVALIMKNSGLIQNSHAGKVLLNILETLPRDDLIQGSEEELLEICMGIFYMQERRRIRMFARMDVYHRFVSCLVYVPKDRFNSDLRHEMEAVLSASFNAQEITFATYFSESVLARIHFIIRVNPQDKSSYDLNAIEKKLIAVGRSWSDDLQQLLADTYGEEESNRLFAKYKTAFPAVYTASFLPRVALMDLKHIEQLSEFNPLEINFYRPLDESPDNFRLKIYQHDNTIPLSDALPIIENLGLRAISERPFMLTFEGGKVTWVNEFSLHYEPGIKFALEDIKELFQAAFSRVWFDAVDNDGFNQLVLAAGCDWRQVSVLRMYAKYLKQIGVTFSQEYIESALNNNAVIAKKLVQLFELRFSTTKLKARDTQYKNLMSEVLQLLDDVSNLDEDKIIRQYVNVISNTLRTNYYQKDACGDYKHYISIKIDSKQILNMPKPNPMCEIFVYAPTFEGIHLRCAQVARGGLRWSDRREDFRTEVLGLMKAQQVKNAVIVPSGAKGGFVAKALPVNGSREDVLNEGIRCYKLFIRGLLDITDNYKDNAVVKPTDVKCYDEDDPYLVVAADKGTATFSDLANEISLEYGFWLGDAFASGGSIGYDHKKMGITAKGAWESVKRHFYEIGMDIMTTDFTVVGIGDMAGDVFGNGMLLSKHIKMIAAFNHMHIFIDPTPDSRISFIERQRLFNLPRSTWDDYDKKLITAGGGVFNRNAKSITVSKEMKHLFGIKSSEIEPNELIKIILKTKVDLLWSGGIGTFVKACTETNADVGDKTNDAIRIDGNQLRCRVVGEGGNLGFTQLARIEYALNGGMVYTDFIDNSAGVSCSDKEVNIKILLNNIVATGDLTMKHRNMLLSEMTDEVAALVLRENYLQPRAISLAASQAFRNVELHSRYINILESSGKLDRKLEFLPDENMLMDSKLQGKGLSCPSIAVLFCYSKILLKEAILDSDVPEDQFLNKFLVSSFPTPLQKSYSKQMQSHPLRREIIATRVSNIIINEMGFSFVYRLQDETGAPVSAIVRSYMVARSVLDFDNILTQIEALDGTITAQAQLDIMMIYVRLLRRISRWFLRNQRLHLDIEKAVKMYGDGVVELKKALPGALGETARNHYDAHYQQYIKQGIPVTLARELTTTRGLFAALDIVEEGLKLGIKITKAAEIYFCVGDFLDLGWVRSQIIEHPTESHWEVLSREALRDDLDWQQRQLTVGLILFNEKKTDIKSCMSAWADIHHGLIARWRQVLANLRSSSTLDYTMFFVATRELLDLTQTSIQLAGSNSMVDLNP